MAPHHYPLPKIIDNRFQQYLILPRDSQGSNNFSSHAIMVSQNGQIDIYSDNVYDFGDHRFPGKGCFSNFCSQPIKVDGVVYHTAEHYLRVMSSTNPKEAADVFFDHNLGHNSENSASLATRRKLINVVVQAKLTQHPDVIGELLASGNKYMAYASTNDYYGIGLKGQGKNVLGEVYMSARDEVLRAILRGKKIGKIDNPSLEQIRVLAEEFEDEHPQKIAETVMKMTGRSLANIIDEVYPGGPSKVQTPQELNNASLLNAIRVDPRYKTHHCSDGYEYLRPHLSKTYHEQVHDQYQDLFNEKEIKGTKMIRPISDYRGTNPFYGPIDFLARGVGPIPGPAPLAVISAVICFGLIATGVGAIGVAAAAITFSVISGAVQGYKSAKDNGLDFKKTIIATVLGAALGALAPWPGLGPLMSALYVKAIEKGLVMGKKAIDTNFPHNENDRELEKGRGVNVVAQQSKGVEVSVTERTSGSPKRFVANRMSAAVREAEDSKSIRELAKQVASVDSVARTDDSRVQARRVMTTRKRRGK